MAAVEGIIAQLLAVFAGYAVIALSFNIEYGFTGIPNFGKAFFVAIGGYSAAVLTASILLRYAAALPQETVASVTGATLEQLRQYAAEQGAPLYCDARVRNLMAYVATHTSTATLLGIFIAAAIVAMLLGAAASVLASYPALRLREDYLAITLLAVSEIFRLVTYNTEWPACSYAGISGIPSPFVGLGLRGTLVYGVFALLIAGGVYLLVEYMTNSPWGRALKAVRDDELAAEVYGYDIGRYRMQSLLVGSALAALGGVLLLFYSGTAAANNYKPDLAFEVIMAVILGGTANNLGVLVGAFIVALLSVFLSPSSLEAVGISLPENIANGLTMTKYVIIGVLIILVLMYRPQGLLPEGPLRTPVVEKTREKLEKALERIARAAGGAAPRSTGEAGQG